MRVHPIEWHTNCSRQLGASLVEYALLLGIVATVGIGAMRSIGGAMVGSADPCNPGLLVKAAIILGEPSTANLSCETTQEQQSKEGEQQAG